MVRDTAKVRSIFLTAVERYSAEKWPAYLDGACGEDAELRERVERLLGAHGGQKPLHVPAPSLPGATVNQLPLERPGTVIGPYKLMEQIGEGGMGVVYVAEQAQPVRRKVALKLVKPGMDTKQVIARFEAERQALAMMDHPNIAKVHDAGTTESGRPYFVMELVRGLPITEYCDGERLSIRERLELFVLICRAVQHAHQKGIIHRDLKPSNILVTLHDGVPVPKVIDFGIAKATGPSLTEKTIYTGFAQLVGTPLYMSPEQVELSGLDVDTRGDIYSLGVLLYELLTGTTPFESETIKKAAFDEMRRIIREDEPPTPSTRLSSLDATLTTTSAKRSSDPRHLNRLVRGELDWITMKALEKNRTRRYQTANSLAADVMRHLIDQPVEACPPSASYRLAKFARRNRGVLTTVAVVSSALALGTVVSTWQAIRATRANQAEATQRQRAEAGERQARANLKKAREAVDQMLVRVAGRLGNVPHMEQVRRGLLADSLKYYEGFLQAQGTDPEVRFETGLAYVQFGTMQRTLGEDRPAEQAFLQAIRIFQELAERIPGNRDYRFNLAQSHNELGKLEFDRGHHSEAEQAFREALAITRKLDADFPNQYRNWIGGRLHNIGLVLIERGELAEAENVHRENLAMRLETPEDTIAVFESLSALADVLYKAGRFGEAEQYGRQALSLQEKRTAQNPGDSKKRLNLAQSHGTLGVILQELHQLAEAETAYRECLAISEKLAADFPDVPGYRQNLATGHYSLGELQVQMDQLPEAEASYRRVQEHYERLAKEHTDTPHYRRGLGAAMGNLGLVLVETGKLGEAQDLTRRSLSDAETLALEYPDVKDYRKGLAFAHQNLGIVEYRVGDWNAAVASLRKGYELNSDHEDDGDAQFVLSMAQWKLGDKEQARAVYDRAVQWMDKSENHDPGIHRLRAEAARLINVTDKPKAENTPLSQ